MKAFRMQNTTAMLNFIGIKFLEEQVPDAITLLKLRQLLEEDLLGKAISKDIKDQHEQAGLMMRDGTIIGATNKHSTSSTRNKIGESDPEMLQTKKEEINGIME